MSNGTMNCKHRLEGGTNRPAVYCGRAAKRQVKAEDSMELNDMPVCGTHGNFWSARGFVVVPIVDGRDKDNP
jgi:hypothetical protein